MHALDRIYVAELSDLELSFYAPDLVGELNQFLITYRKSPCRYIPGSISAFYGNRCRRGFGIATFVIPILVLSLVRQAVHMLDFNVNEPGRVRPSRCA